MNPIEEYIAARNKQVLANMEDRDLRMRTQTFFEEAIVKSNYVKNFTWMGVPILQLPSDLMVMQELIYKIKPDFIIETGVAFGGMTAFYSDILYSIAACFDSRVIGIDTEFRSHTKTALYPYRSLRGLRGYYDGRVSLFNSNSTSIKLHKRLRSLTTGKKVLVSLDSNHTHDHVLAELRLYSSLVSVDSFIIVFDTTIEEYGHVDPEKNKRPWGPGNNPATAVKAFLQETDDFVVDKEIEQRALISAAPGGWLKRIK